MLKAQATLGTLTLLLAALLTTPVAAAAVGFGQVATLDDPDVIHVLEPLDLPDRVAFVDDDTDARLDPGEAIYLAQGAATAPGDLRLTPSPSGPAGSLVRGQDGDAGIPLVELRGQWAVLDNDGDGAFSPGDTLYHRTERGREATLASEDLTVTGPDAGTLAGAAGATLRTPLLPYPGTLSAVDHDGDGRYSLGDPIYLDTNRDRFVTVLDVRLDGASFGHVVQPSDPEATAVLLSPGAPDRFTYLDADGDSRWDPGEPAYLSRATSRLAPGDLRIAAPLHGGLGSQVQASDRDATANLASLPGVLATVDLDGDGRDGPGDVLILDMSGQGRGVFSAEDLVLTGERAGERAGTDARGLGLGVLAAIGQVDANMQRLITEQLPKGSPAFFLVDIQPDQWPEVETALLEAGARGLDSVEVV
ncbi:MAG: hypothetical protein R3185_07940, partial [Candidatus Thermoplasmatota archaeon]|nr:hypothetical protein [Candidatus Thermoplasmatota archaeon]